MDMKFAAKLLPFYHGTISSETAAELLEEVEDGTYLLRDSKMIPGALCLCLVFRNAVHTYRILQVTSGYCLIQTLPSSEEQYFQNLFDIIANYHKLGQGLVAPLRFPMEKIIFSAQERDQEDQRNGYITVIPLPPPKMMIPGP
ncbi:SH2 domain-containing protein 1A-like [Heptranchias perlo]|uniref:SH2 domain-containing protein 1A-like n=1 Tax=Heptranchias perlo TaxID=212740 RepID=UPI00355989FB